MPKPIPRAAMRVATQGTSEIHAETLIASYSESSSQIEHVVAEGAVKIMSPLAGRPMAITAISIRPSACW